MDQDDKQAISVVTVTLGIFLIVGSAISLAYLLGGTVAAAITGSICGLVLYLGGRSKAVLRQPGANSSHYGSPDPTIGDGNADQRRVFEIREGETPDQAFKRLHEGR